MKVLLIGGFGYIGSSIQKYLRPNFDCLVHSLDIDLFRFQGDKGAHLAESNFNSLSKQTLSYYDVIILLAGHSSVPFCEADPRGSLMNNCIDFFHLVEKIGETQKFIYASSGSVYGNSGGTLSKETDEFQIPIKEYDKQKQLVDLYMSRSYTNFYGLRFGTVCGFSENPRNELMINSMTRDAINKGRVIASCSDSHRAILGMKDLCQAIKAIIDKPNSESGFYNLASFNMTIGEIGTRVSNYFKSNLTVTNTGNSNYSFQLDTSKFRKEFEFEFLETVESICKEAEKNDFTMERKWDQRL